MAKPLTASSLYREVRRGVKFLFVTALFAIFCVLAFFGIWYLFHMIDNNSYRVVGAFLVIIAFSNIFGKYLVWAIDLYA